MTVNNKNVPHAIEKYVQAVDDFMKRYPTVTMNEHLEQVEEATGYHKVYFFVVLSMVVTGLLSLIGGMKLLVDLLGFVYPAYMSFKSMDSSSSSSNTNDTQWLTYWVVFSAISILETLLYVVTSMIPFYYWLKCATIVWMYHPSMRGAETIYTQGLRPWLLPYLSKTTQKGD